MPGRLAVLLFLAVPAFCQMPCEGTPAYSPCEFTFDLSAADLAAHPNPYVSAQLHAEFRSPHFKTYLMPAFWDGGRKFIIRFTPTEAGPWTYRTTSNIAAFDGKEGAFAAAPSDSPGLSTPQIFIIGPPTTRSRTYGWATLPIVSRSRASRSSKSSSAE